MQSTMSQGSGELAPPQGLIQDPQRSAHLVRENRCYYVARNAAMRSHDNLQRQGGTVDARFIRKNSKNIQARPPDSPSGLSSINGVSSSPLNCFLNSVRDVKS